MTVPGEKTVLLVEDDDGVRRAMVRLLSVWGCQLLQAGSVEAAVEILEAHTVDAIILDIGLGEQRGVEVARVAATLTPPPTIIVATGDASPSETVELLELGVELVLEKPLDLERLEAALLQPPSPALLEPVIRRLVGRRQKPELERLVGNIMVQEALTRTSGNLSRAASLLGITRQALHQRLRAREREADDDDDRDPVTPR
ncbi:MAG: response regulator [Sandaracinaceae bacterium]|nr:response regulator [Sandaracinaceae bacterium]